MESHAFKNSNPAAFDSDCAVCGGKHRDAIHPKTGQLMNIGRHNLGRENYLYFQCVDCKSDFPCIKENGIPWCNGSPISKCPFCAPQASN